MTAFNEKGNLIPDLHHALLLTGFALALSVVNRFCFFLAMLQAIAGEVEVVTELKQSTGSIQTEKAFRAIESKVEQRFVYTMEMLENTHTVTIDVLS